MTNDLMQAIDGKIAEATVLLMMATSLGLSPFKVAVNEPEAHLKACMIALSCAIITKQCETNEDADKYIALMVEHGEVEDALQCFLCVGEGFVNHDINDSMLSGVVIGEMQKIAYIIEKLQGLTKK